MYQYFSKLCWRIKIYENISSTLLRILKQATFWEQMYQHHFGTCTETHHVFLCHESYYINQHGGSWTSQRKSFCRKLSRVKLLVVWCEFSDSICITRFTRHKGMKRTTCWVANMQTSMVQRKTIEVTEKS